MSPRVPFALAGLLGGACWVARAFVAPEPLRWAGIELTRRSLAKADANGGKENLWLRTMDRLGLGFDS